ncbi:hypothetical protein [uncultured Granulicatella sp.]|jgi:hypothetical protein|uniref:hypothetical protein n=1 Tax=uncultured Granulicatella sp. TaxID=316089 RepID=UPI0028E5467A|nr:hypothetical protein [uncultured Granulicatella sp.]
MIKNFLQLTRKQQIITIVVYTVIAAITMYLGYKQSQAPVVTTNSLTGFQSAQLPSAPDNSILGWLNFHKIGLVFAPVSVLILDYFKIYLIRKGFILKTLLSAGLILLFTFLLQVALAIVFGIVVLAIALGILFNEFGSGSGSYSSGGDYSAPSNNNNDAFNAEQARLASEQDAERRRQQDIDRYEKAAYEYQSRGLNRAADEMNQRANNLK